MASESISKLAFKAMVLRLFIVIVISSLASYWYNYQLIRSTTMKELSKYAQERVERESLLIAFNEKNLKLFKEAFDYEFNNFQTTKKEFINVVEKDKAGNFVHRKTTNPYHTQIHVYKDLDITNEVMSIITHSVPLLQGFGHAWSNNLVNIGIIGPEGYMSLYWPGRPHVLENLPSIHDFKSKEWVQIGLPKNNPTGKLTWTSPYFSEIAKDWVITANYPYYHEGRYLFSIVSDVYLSALYDRSMKNSLEGAYNIIFSRDGKVIVHPQLMNEIKKRNGSFYPTAEKYPELLNMFNSVRKASHSRVIYNRHEKIFLASGLIKGPDWLFVIVYPEQNLSSVAAQTGLFVAVMGLISLIVELIILQQILQKYVSRPIKKLISASNRIARGDMHARVDIGRNDELGILGKAFNIMGQKIMERDKELIEQATRLESEVRKRTHELDSQRAKSYQASKMATLGEMAGGIAHEINNPLAIISMSTEALTRQLKNKSLNDENILSYAQRIQRTADRISKVVKGMKSFSRDATNDPKMSISVEDIITSTLTLCQQNLESSDIFLTIGDIPDIKIYCREIEIVQALMNLIQNAADALEKVEEKHIEIKTTVVGRMIQIAVENSGPKISDSVAEKLMTPFFTTKDVGKGVGLGLFTSNGLIKSNGGRLFLDQRSQKTKFIIELPVETTV